MHLAGADERCIIHVGMYRQMGLEWTKTVSKGTNGIWQVDEGL